MTADPIPDGIRKSAAAVGFGRLFRVMVAGGLLWYAAKGIDWPLVWQALSESSWAWMSLAAALVVLDRALMARRWVTLLRAVEPNRSLPLPALLRVFFVTNFAGAFLPGSVGGDALRTVAVTRLGVSTANAVASVAVDRLLGIVSVLVMSAFGLWLVGRLVDYRLAPIAVASTIAAGAAIYGLLFDDRIYRWMLTAAGARRWPTLDRLAHKFLSAAGQYGHHHRALTGVLVASVVVQIIRTLQVFSLGMGLGITAGIEWYFAVVPVIVLIMLLPISVAGLGTGNAAFVSLFALAGVDKEVSFVLSVLYMSLGIVGNLPGGLLLAAGGDPVPRLPAD